MDSATQSISTAPAPTNKLSRSGMLLAGLIVSSVFAAAGAWVTRPPGKAGRLVPEPGLVDFGSVNQGEVKSAVLSSATTPCKS